MDLDRLITRHKDAVYRQMVRTCGNREDAEDALADALLSAIKAIHRLEDQQNFQAWLSKIGSRACGRRRIRDRLLQTTSIEDLERMGFDIRDGRLGPSETVERTALKSCVAGAIESLPETYREVYLRREIQGDKAEDVAAVMNLSIPAVKSRLHRARFLVREALDTGFGCQGLTGPSQ